MTINTNKEGNPVVGIVGGSTSDFPILKKAVDLLTDLDVESELKVVSAHRTPDWLFEYAEAASSLYTNLLALILSTYAFITLSVTSTCSTSPIRYTIYVYFNL